MVFVNLHPLKNHQILDVELGTGRTENVLLAQTTGSSITTECAFLSLINAKLSISQELVSHVMKDIT